jgi:predicted AAA+ superfamily ATPase
MEAYKYRIGDKILREKLEVFGAVLIEGPKWCGKTTTAAQQAGSILQMQDPDYRDAYLTTAHTKPSLLLQGATPRLIDEWQIAPVLWDAVRITVDKAGEAGRFILTGSNSTNSDKIMHSGTGRIARMRIYPMSLLESGESNGKISFAA